MMSRSDDRENYSAEWYTPPDWMAWIARQMEGDVYDPFQPGRDDAMTAPWGAETYANHPGRAGGDARRWWARYRAQAGHIRRIVWAIFNVEHLVQLHPSPLQLPGTLVWPLRRIAWVDGRDGCRDQPRGVSLMWVSGRKPLTGNPPVPCLYQPTGDARLVRPVRIRVTAPSIGRRKTR